VADAKRFAIGRSTGRPTAVTPSRRSSPTSFSPAAHGPTNGWRWRLYAAAGDLVEGASYEIDLPALPQGGTGQDFRYFAAFFSAQAFSRDQRGGSVLDRALDESTANAVAVGQALERQVFSAVPLIAQRLLREEQRSF
jgi:hypothetical protein